MQQISTFLDVVGASEKDIDFFERDFLGLGDEEPDVSCEADVDGEEEVEGGALNSSVLVCGKQMEGELTSHGHARKLGRTAGR